MKQTESSSLDKHAKTHAIRHTLSVIVGVILVAAVLAAVYLVLLIGEPEEENKNTASVQEELIYTPMLPIEALGSGGMSSLPDTFGKPVLAISGMELQKSRIHDTAYNGSYARTATLYYTIKDGSSIELISLRPTSAAPLLASDGGFQLNGEKLYTLAGLNAALMENGKKIVIFTQTEDAVYAVVFMPEQKDTVMELIYSTVLLESQTHD